MEHLITNCCGENILYEKEVDGSLSMWEFCKDCLEPFTPITEHEFEILLKERVNSENSN